MRSKFLAGLAAFVTVASALSASSADAQTVQTPSASSGDNAVGFLVRYRAGVDPIAPNGQPTGENFAGVDLENSRNLGGQLYAVEFARDLSDEQATEALQNLKTDPRVEKVEFDRFVFMQGLKQEPLAPPSQLCKARAEKLGGVYVRKACMASIQATDSWLAGNTPRVTIQWSKPTTKYSGSIIGYRLQVYVSGVWKTLKEQTTSTARSYTTTSKYLKAGVENYFRIAAIARYSGRNYLGYYKLTSVTPTAAPKTPTSIQIVNNILNLEISWAGYTSLKDTGGLPVSYWISVTKPDLTQVPCQVSGNSCQVVDLTNGVAYRVTLTVTNERASVSFTKTFTYTSFTPVNASNDTWFSKQWYLNSNETFSAKVSGAWATETGSPSVVVAIIDTGYTDHPDIDSARILPGYDFISDATKSNDGNAEDSDAHDPGDYKSTGSNQHTSSWHGTHVMGIIGATDNDIGVVGVAPNVKLLPVRVLGSTGGTVADIIAGIKWAAGISMRDYPDNPNPAKVINMSIGGGSLGCDSETEAALATAKSRGITVVTAAGNENGPAPQSYPGNCYPTINIGSSGKLGKPAFYSNYSVMYNGQAIGVDVSAPGGDFCQGGDNGQIYSTLNSGTTTLGSSKYEWENGTSMASPVVAGIVALMYSAKLRQNPSTPLNGTFVESVWDALSSTATPFASQTPIGCPGSSPRNPTDGSNYGGYGAGIVNASAAIQKLLHPTP